MEYLNKLKKYLQENKAEYKLLTFDESVATSTEAAKQLVEKAEDIVKSVAFYKNDLVIIAIVRKQDRVEKQKISKTLNITGINLCSPEETLDKTGYPAGGVPPLGFKAEFIMDEKAAEKKEVIAGGGNKTALIKIKTQELLRLNKAKISDIKK